jgi:hypothetical protein
MLTTPLVCFAASARSAPTWSTTPISVRSSWPDQALGGGTSAQGGAGLVVFAY